MSETATAKLRVLARSEACSVPQRSGRKGGNCAVEIERKIRVKKARLFAGAQPPARGADTTHERALHKLYRDAVRSLHVHRLRACSEIYRGC